MAWFDAGLQDIFLKRSAQKPAQCLAGLTFGDREAHSTWLTLHSKILFLYDLLRQRSQSASQLNRKRVSRIVQVAFTAVGIEMPHLSVVVNGLFLLTRSDQPLHWHAQASRKGALGFFTYQINKELSLHQLVCKSSILIFYFYVFIWRHTFQL